MAQPPIVALREHLKAHKEHRFLLDYHRSQIQNFMNNEFCDAAKVMPMESEIAQAEAIIQIADSMTQVNSVTVEGLEEVDGFEPLEVKE